MSKKKEIVVEEYDHAILVRGTASIKVARQALKDDGWNKAARRLPCRPFYKPQFGACVAFYFTYGPHCTAKCEARHGAG